MDNRYKNFISLAKLVFNTEDGKKLLAYLKSSYVDSSSIGDTPHMTYYKLGQKELIQILLQQVTDERDIDEIINTINY